MPKGPDHKCEFYCDVTKNDVTSFNMEVKFYLRKICFPNYIYYKTKQREKKFFF